MIEREERGAVAVLRLAHGKVSAFDLELLSALDRELAAVEEGSAAALVLTGSGRVFSAGVDLRRVAVGGAAYLAEFLPRFTAVLERLVRLRRPVVAAVNGHAIAGGLVFACACDVRLMAAGDGKVGLSELEVGVPFPWLAQEVVRAALGGSEARRLILGGRLLSAAEAAERGVMNALTPADELLERAVEEGRRLGAIPRPAFALAKSQLARPLLERLSDAAIRRHDAEVARVWSAPQTLESIRSFVERTLGG